MVKFKKRIIVTSALPYANGEIHIGHLVEYIQADIFVRFLKLSGRNVIYCCADDTHGTPIELKSRDLGIKPEQLIDRYSKEHQEDFKNFHIKFDSYYSTNSSENKIFSDKIFNILLKKGHIYKKSIKVMYSEKSKRFLPDRFIKGGCPKCHAKDQYGDVCESCGATYEPTNLIDPYSVTDGSKPILKESEHYFFRLSKLSKFLKDYITTNSTFQEETKNFVLNWIKDGLEDWDISRDGPYFGFKIPGEKNKFYYVWLDAPIGYISSLANYFKGDTKKAEKVWNESDIIHFIGKDITYFHFLFWPAMLYAAGFKLPQSIFVHGFLTVGGEKMSKSRGTFLTAKEFLKKYDAEHLRFYYANVLSKKLADINLDFKEFKDRVNNELLGNLGNFCYRVISFTNNNFKGEIDGIEDEKKIIADIKHRVNSISKYYEELNFNSVIHEILQISDIGNRYFQKNEPWSLIKDDRIKVQKVCGLCVNITKILSVLIGPILPLFSKNLQNQLNLENLGWNDLQFDIITHKIGEEKLLVRKLEEVAQQTFPLNLKVAEIVDIKDHPNAEKLYILKINLGSEVRQLIAGLKDHYSKDELKGKKLIVITNLKYAKIRGVESQGMLLAAEDSNNVGILTVKKSIPGTPVSCGTLKSSVQQISFEKFQKIKINVKKGKVLCGGNTLKAGTEYLYPEKIKGEAKVR